MRGVRSAFAVVLGLGVLSACSKDNEIDASQSTEIDVGKQCDGPNDPGCGVGGVCVLGVCRLGCTTDSECPQGALCIGDRAPFGCSIPSELACSSSQPCSPPLACGIDGKCRFACQVTGDCPRNEHECKATTCVSHNEVHAGANPTWTG